MSLAGVLGIAEDVRVPAHHLVDDLGGYIRETERSFFLGDYDLEGEVQQQIPQFVYDRLAIARLDRLSRFVSLLDQMRHQSSWRLLDIPGTTALGVPEPLQERQDAGEIGRVVRVSSHG